MRLFFMTKEEQVKALYHLTVIARFVHRNNILFSRQSLTEYAETIEALAELAYAVAGIPGMNTVKKLGFEWDGDVNG